MYYKGRKKLFSLAFFCLALSSCVLFSKNTNRNTAGIERSTANKLLDFKYTEPAWLTEHPSIKAEVDKIIEEEIIALSKEARALFEEIPSSVLLPYQLHIEELKLFKPADRDITSVRIKAYTYTGGAHGGRHFTSWNWSRKQKKFLSLEKVLTSEQFEKLKEKARQKLFEREKQKDSYDKFRQQHINRGTENIEDFEIWNFHKNGIIIVFPEYQVASYAAGPIEIFIELKNLK